MLSLSPAHAEPSCAITDQIFPALQKIRGLKLKHLVSCSLQDKNAVLKFVTTETADNDSVQRLKRTELILKKLLVLKSNADYAADFKQFLTDQIGGYYDPKKKHYVMAAWLPDAVQPTVAAHELTHALQDQYFDLQKIADDKNLTTDQLLARTSLIEGDATLAMHDYVQSTFGNGPFEKQDSVDGLIFQTVVGIRAAGQSDQNIPNLVTSLLLFPYTSGLRFVHAVAHDGGFAAVNSIFTRLPCNTAEVLHPDQYRQRTATADVCPKNLEPLDPKNQLTDSLGEFFFVNWLKEVAHLDGTSLEVASQWQADLFELNANHNFKWRVLLKGEGAAQMVGEKLKSVLTASGLIISWQPQRGGMPQGSNGSILLIQDA